MKRYIICAFLVLMTIGIWQEASQRKADAYNADVQLALMALGQAPSMSWRPIIRIPKVVEILRKGQLIAFEYHKLRLSSNLKYAQGRPDGFHISVLDPNGTDGSVPIPRDDYIADVIADLAQIDAHIALLTE